MVFLATTALGAQFSSASTNARVKRILDRLLQLKPICVFMDDAAVYNGKQIDLRSKIKDVVDGLGDVQEFNGIVSIPRHVDHPADLEFVRTDFRSPFLVVYSSATTGKPKPTVQSAGRYLLNGTKESRLHRDIGANSTILQYTTTGWIMDLAAIAGLVFGRRTILYDGSPFLPDVKEIADLSNLSVTTSTGMVLSESLSEWFYSEGFPAHTQLANISGGTDLAGCFGLENPISPLYVGGCQCAGLGIPIAVFDQADEGASGVKGTEIPDSTPGEIVATGAFPTMPVRFLGEDGSQKYFDSYFARFDSEFDFLPVTQCEIYNVTDTQFTEEVVDSNCVGQGRPQDSDESLVGRVKEAICKALNARLVPKYIFQTPEIPTTVNLRKVQLPVK
ncbi:hypothetical protein EYZ11_008881 [Aspergillus tanneri]|uniref:AMP-dependent synthetase/ligase domain-containing protein n=1 Tax=Aspergillus tanneri TaxID=1220188 RepID=A0A4S3JEV2_9EURO|nr:hypothetical protein EYZ11_008881 [Aspergillus tanneri]